MGRLFNGSNQYLVATGSALLSAGFPFSVNIWYRTTNTSAGMTAQSVTNAALQNRQSINCQGNVVGDPNRATLRFDDGAQLNAVSGSVVTTDTWTMITGVYRGVTNWSCYLNGSGRGDQTSGGVGTPAFPTMDQVYLGVLNNGGTLQNYFDGALAEYAIWTSELTDSDVANLYVGGQARFANEIQPGSLALYARYVDDDTSTVGPDLSPVNGPTFTDHPDMAPPIGTGPDPPVSWTAFRPGRLKPCWTTNNGQDLKSSCTTALYNGGDPTSPDELKASIVNKLL